MNIQPKDTSKGHFHVSLVKSFTRIIAGFCLIFSVIEPSLMERYIVMAGSLLILAEVLGIIEELV